jgi:hypothetical protein
MAKSSGGGGRSAGVRSTGRFLSRVQEAVGRARARGPGGTTAASQNRLLQLERRALADFVGARTAAEERRLGLRR